MKLLEPGDRVIVIAGDPCCGNPTHIGLIFTIDDICLPNGYAICNRCEALFNDEPMAWVPSDGSERRLGFLLECLQLIPPDTLPAEKRKIEEPVT